MIPNETIYEAGFKSQFFTIILISSSLILTAWSLTKLIINLSKNEENQKQLNHVYQKCIDIINYYLDDLKYVEEAINFIQKKFRHKQVYESVAVEDGLLKPCIKKETIYCQSYYNKVLEKHKADKQLYSPVSIYLTLANGTTLNYIPRYPWYWDGVELFTGIQPNMKKVYNTNYLSPDYVPNLNFENSSTNNVKSDQEARCKEQNTASSSELTDEEKKFNTLLLTKNNTLDSNPIEPSININTEKEFKDKEKEVIENVLVSIPSEYKNDIKTPEITPSLNSESYNKKEQNQKYTESSSLSKEKHVTTIRKSKSLPNINDDKKSLQKHQQKQKFLKKLKHKKQPKIIYPSIPVNPDLSFVPLYKENLNDSRIKSRVKHADMENTYKKLKVEIQHKSK